MYANEHTHAEIYMQKSTSSSKRSIKGLHPTITFKLLILASVLSSLTVGDLSTGAFPFKVPADKRACVARRVPHLLRFRGGFECGGEVTAGDERKRTAESTDEQDKPQGKRARVSEKPAFHSNNGIQPAAAADGRGGKEGTGVESKTMVRIPRDLLKKLRTVMKEVPEEGVAVAKFVDCYQKMYNESLKVVAISLGFSNVTALLTVLPSICRCSLPPPRDGEGDKGGEHGLSARHLKRQCTTCPTASLRVCDDRWLNRH